MARPDELSSTVPDGIRMRDCPACHGHGVEWPHGTTCERCRGSGVFVSQKRVPQLPPYPGESDPP